jgi:hypothetical protein
MPLDNTINTGNSTAGKANVDANFDLMTTTPQVNSRSGGIAGTPNFVGATRLFSEVDSGSLTGTPDLRSPFITRSNRLSISKAVVLFNSSFVGGVQNTGLWRCVFTTMTATQGAGSLLLNANNTATATTGVALYSWRYIPMQDDSSIAVIIDFSITSTPLANQVFEAGMFVPTGTAVPTDGIYLRYTSAGLVGVLNYNGNEGAPISLATPAGSGQLSENTRYEVTIHVDSRQVDWFINGVEAGSQNVPIANVAPCLSVSLPVAVQFRNSGTVTGSPQMQVKVNSVTVIQRDIDQGKPYSECQAAAGLTTYQGMEGGTQGTTALYTNSLAAGAGAAMTNTTAALGTGLGGQFTTQPTLGAGTDGIVCSYQNPAGSLTQPARTLYIRGIRVQGAVSAALTGGPVLYAYSLAYGHTAVSMATPETGSFVTATTKAPRRVPLGLETYAATAAAGTLGAGVFMSFASPLVVNPGEFVAICAKNLGTVTSAGTITFLVTFDGYAE